MNSPEVLGSDPREVSIPYRFDPLFEKFTTGEVYSLEASYQGYIEGWIREQYPDTMPFYLDVEAYCDQLLVSWPGLPTTDNSPVYIPPKKIVETYVANKAKDATKDVQLFGERIKQSIKQSGFTNDECWRVFATEAVTILMQPPAGLQISGEALSVVLSKIPDPINLEFLPLTWLNNYYHTHVK